MSVINKMLRDLDSRQAGQPPTVGSKPAPTASLTAGTVAVAAGSAPQQAAAAPAATRWVAALLVALVLAVGGWVWWVNQRVTEAPAAVVGTVSTPAPAAAVASVKVDSPLAAVSPVVAPAAQAASVSSPMQSEVASTPSAASTSAPVPKSLAASMPAPAPASNITTASPVSKAGPASPSPQLKEATEFSSFKQVSKAGPSAQSVVAAGKQPVPPATAPALVAGEGAKNRQPITQEVLSQVQERWNVGDRQEAISLVQSGIARLEQSPGGDTTALATLAREYVRMTLATGQLAAALNLLSRLEQPLAGVADIWALRGNVAQRLGQHPEAVQAYLKSLELRPNEPRWMLGAAVSLAAQGQVGPASELAERARQAGALKPDVANYLRQLGVVIRPD